MINKYYFLDSFRTLYKDKRLKRDVNIIEDAMMKLSDIGRGITNQFMAITFFIEGDGHDIVMRMNPDIMDVETKDMPTFIELTNVFNEVRIRNDIAVKSGRLIVEFVFKDAFE